ncbi:MAG: restriction endonuclease subunit S [Burkholderiales bacterium]|nr:restriction endonuclease subunit S [Burkholderiales bacterium]
MIGGLKPYPKMKDSGVQWLGEVPEHWEVRKVREVGRVINGFPFDAGRFSQSTGYPLIRIRDLDKARTVARYDGPFMESARVNPGDVLIGMDGDFNVGTWRGVEPALLNQRMCCIRCAEPATERFVAYSLPGPLKQINDVTWSTTVKHLASGQVERIQLSLPPLPEQSAIVRFLDHADRRIRRYIRARQKLIKLLEEQKQAIIHRAVTRGLDPNVRLKPSGVEWLGDVPAHWEVLRCRYIFREVDERSADGSEQHLSMSQRLGLVPSDLVENRTLVSESYAGGKLCEVGDLVLNRLKAHLGVFALARHAGVISPDYTVLRPVDSTAIEYFERVLRSPVFRYELRVRAKGIVEGFWRLYTDDFYDIRLPVPPPQERNAIVAHFVAETATAEQAVRKAEREIALLREYRTRLIADVVTGKLDVREAAARLPQESEELEPLDEAEAFGEAEDESAVDNLDSEPQETEA